MKKTTLFLIIAILLITVAVCLTPWITWINLTLDAVELDAEGNAVGTVQIHMEGCKLDYLFLTDRLQVSIAPFDNLTNLKASTSNGVEGAIRPGDDKEYFRISYGGLHIPSDEMFFGDLGFSADLDRWIFCAYVENTEAYYVASASGSDTTETLVEYFKGLTPYDWSPN